VKLLRQQFTTIGDIDFLTDGVYQIVATANNGGSDVLSLQVNVTVDVTDPVPAITDPTNGAVVTASSIDVSGTVIELNDVVNITVNGVVGFVDNSVVPKTFTVQNVPLADGENHLIATATDVADNAGVSATVTVTYNAPVCEDAQVGEFCTVDADCCSNKCRGKSGSKTCK
jgi:hypothetical protein